MGKKSIHGDTGIVSGVFVHYSVLVISDWVVCLDHDDDDDDIICSFHNLKKILKKCLWYRHKRKTPTPSKSNSSKKVDSFLDWTTHRAICGAGNCKLELIKWGCLVKCCTPNSVSIHGIYCVLHGFLRILTHKYPVYRAYIGISHRGTLGSGYIPAYPLRRTDVEVWITKKNGE